MDISSKKLPGSQQEILITLLSDEFAAYEEKAVSVIQRDFVLEGFRRGKVPAGMIRQAIGPENLLQETVRVAVRETYREALKREEINPLGEPEVIIRDTKAGAPFSFTIRVAVFPDIALPDYRAIAKKAKRKQVAVEEKEMDQALLWLRESRKKEDGALPELDDEFARGVGAFADMAALRESISKGIFFEKSEREVQRVRQEIAEKIAQETRAEIPRVLVDKECAELVEQTKGGVRETLRIEFAEYLTKIKKTEEEFKKTLVPQAEKRVKQFLVLEEIAKQESIVPSEEEIQEEIKRFLRQFPGADAARKQIDPARLKLYAEGVLRNEKTFQFLEQLIA